MCLLGNTGGLFQCKYVNSKRKIMLVENLEFIHPAEVEICNKLAELGNNYLKMQLFVEKYSFEKIYDVDAKDDLKCKFMLFFLNIL